MTKSRKLVHNRERGGRRSISSSSSSSSSIVEWTNVRSDVRNVWQARGLLLRLSSSLSLVEYSKRGWLRGTRRQRRGSVHMVYTHSILYFELEARSSASRQAADLQCGVADDRVPRCLVFRFASNVYLLA